MVGFEAVHRPVSPFNMNESPPALTDCNRADGLRRFEINAGRVVVRGRASGPQLEQHFLASHEIAGAGKARPVHHWIAGEGHGKERATGWGNRHHVSAGCGSGARDDLMQQDLEAVRLAGR